MLATLLPLAFCLFMLVFFSFVSMKVQWKIFPLISPGLNLLLGLVIVLLLSLGFSHLALFLPIIDSTKLTILTSTISMLSDLIKIAIGAIISTVVPKITESVHQNGYSNSA